ncbi:MAG TPA: PucR family transcriptional regulator [Lachnospiraceae bacterium]|nr:PucR family transcriptional regulator [Lachnospiraceae bacterium]
MGFTIEDMLVVSQDRYKMVMVAGSAGWSNSISWLLMLEDLTIIHNFTGKEFAVTTGLGFQKEEDMLRLARELHTHNASGLLVNTGYYVKEIPRSVKEYCDESGFPLLVVPWEISLSDLMKDITIRIFVQSETDEQISGALIRAIEQPEAQDLYTRELLPHFDLDGTFEVALVTTGDLDKMDTVERRRMAYRMQLYLTNLTHNGHFFYYASYFVIIMNAMEEEECAEILEAFAERVTRRIPDRKVYIGVSDQVKDIENLHLAYKRARAAAEMAVKRERGIQFFDQMGLYRMLYMVEDRALLKDLSDKPLSPLIEYDRDHNGEYLMTLESFLRNGGSIKAVSEELFVHRNTILYRMANIKSLLGSSLETPEERMVFMVACMIRQM